MLQLPAFCGRLMRGEVTSIQSPELWEFGPLNVWECPFPPALVPIGYRESAFNSLYGSWLHWFGPRRQTWVKAFEDYRTELIEIGRSFEQFAIYHAIHYAECEGDDDALLVFLRECEFDEALLAETAKWFDVCGDGFERYAEHPAFKNDPALECVSEDVTKYRGDFPHPGMSAAQLWNCSGIEVSDELRASFPDQKGLPPWLQDYPREDIDRLFDDYLGQGKLWESWLCLNCGGWEGNAAVRAIRQLAERAGDPKFDVLASAWAEVHQDNDGLR
ncbi:MAG: hypothetical protein WD066_11200 [Planctomycetaceae bacterium]